MVIVHTIVEGNTDNNSAADFQIDLAGMNTTDGGRFVL